MMQAYKFWEKIFWALNVFPSEVSRKKVDTRSQILFWVPKNSLSKALMEEIWILKLLSVKI